MKTIITIENGKVTVETDDGVEDVINVNGGEASNLYHPRGEMRGMTIVHSNNAEENKPAPPPASRPERLNDSPAKPKKPARQLVSAEHKKAKQAEYNRRYRIKQIAKQKGVPLPKPEEKVEWCKFCVAFTTHSSKTHPRSDPPKAPKPEFLPGHEKSTAEIDSWRPRTILPGTAEYNSAPRDDTEAGRMRKK